MDLVRAGGLTLVAALAAAIGIGCTESGGSSRSASTAPGSVQAPPAQVVPQVVDLQVAPLVRGDAGLSFRLVDPAAASAQVEVRFSLDGGATWTPATRVGTSGALASASAPGALHTLTWASAADVPGFEAAARLEVRAVGGGSASASLAVDNQPVNPPVPLTRQPYLQSTTATATELLWRTAASTDTTVEYGPTPALGLSAGDPQARTVAHRATLSGLSAGTTYYYRLLAGGQPLTPRLSFQSAPAPADAELTFLVVGDSGMGNPEQHQIAALMAAEQEAELFLHTGDVVYPIGGLGAAVQEYDARFFRPYQAMLTRIPAFPVVGNHDLYGLFGQPFRDTFVLPPNGGGSLLEELYFSFEWGDAKFVALETNVLYQFTPLGPHITWLRDQLATNTKKWLIVYMHTPPYSAGKHGDNGRLQSLLEPLFERHAVDLVLAGHDHDYERTHPLELYNTDPAYPGLVHVVTGGGGAALRPVTPTARTAVAQSVYHYVKVRAEGDWLHGQAIDINGQVIDTWSVPDR